MSADAAKAIVRRNTEEVQSRGNFEVFEELFAVDLAGRRRRACDDVQDVSWNAPGNIPGVAPTGRSIHCETVDVMRVRNGKITEHWGVANLFSLMQQLEQLDDYLGALEVSLTDEQAARLTAVSAVPLGAPHEAIAGVTDRLAGGDRSRLRRPASPAA